MSTRNQEPLRSEIYQRIDKKETDELLALWRQGKREQWNGPAFDIVEEILRRRLVRIPPQQPPFVPRARPPKTPWLIMAGGMGAVFIVTAVLFNAIRNGTNHVEPASTAAAAWTAGPTQEATPTSKPGPTATLIESPAALPTESPAALITGGLVEIREGPGTEYLQLGLLNKDEELDVIGQVKDCTWLKVSSHNQSIVGWIAWDARFVDLRIACENIPPGTFRPWTSVVKANQSGSGDGELTVDNGTTRDGVVILSLNDDAIMAAYIRSGDSFTLKGIPDGTYYLYFSTGEEWNGKAFTITPSHQKFEDAFIFTTGATTYTIWSVTLHGVVGGTASTEDVDESEFPGIGD